MSLSQTRPDLVWRYQNDPVFNRLVDVMTAVMLEHNVTQEDLSAAMLVAVDKAEYTRNRNRYVPSPE